MKLKDEYRPIPFRKGNTIIKTYETDFDDGFGHKARIINIDYADKKGKITKGFVLNVRWI